MFSFTANGTGRCSPLPPQFIKTGAANLKLCGNRRDVFAREHQKNLAPMSLIHFVCFAANGLRYR